LSTDIIHSQRILIEKSPEELENDGVELLPVSNNEEALAVIKEENPAFSFLMP
jgi:hypothetical protein